MFVENGGGSSITFSGARPNTDSESRRHPIFVVLCDHTFAGSLCGYIYFLLSRMEWNSFKSRSEFLIFFPPTFGEQIHAFKLK